MTDPRDEHDPIDVLRRTNPAGANRLPPGSETRLRARVMEDTMESTESNLARGTRSGRSFWPALSAAGALGLVVAVVVGAGILGQGGGAPLSSAVPSTGPGASAPVAGGGTATPGPTGGPIGAGGMAMCAFLYDLDTLRDREWAFDGTLSAIEGNQGTFAVSRWFTGGEGVSVTVTVDGMTAESGLLGGPGLEVGGRYLVAGDDEFAWSCGFTQYWNADVAADWARVLGG